MERVMSDIKRKDAVKWLTNLIDDCGRYQDLWHYAEALDQIIELLDTDVAPVRHGRWEKEYGHYRCLLCNGLDDFADNYCPNCGARMDGDGNE